MLLKTLFVVSVASLGQAAAVVKRGTAGTTTTTWDCCKPACGWTSNLPSGTTGVVASCSASNEVLSDASTENACDGGTAYSCDTFQPQIINSTWSYAFAGHTNTATTSCCQCYQFSWTSGAGEGKNMIVQAVNAGGITDVDFDIYTPGGGVGSEEACSSQYDTSTTGWGAQYGGVSSDSDCDALPSNLQAGCHWRFEWAGGTVNEWTIDFQQVNCPAELTSVSGCYPPSI